MSTQLLSVQPRNIFLSGEYVHADFYIVNVELQNEAYHGADIELQSGKTPMEVVEAYHEVARRELLAFIEAKYPGRYV